MVGWVRASDVKNNINYYTIRQLIDPKSWNDAKKECGWVGQEFSVRIMLNNVDNSDY